MMLLWNSVNKFLCGHMFSIVLAIYPGVELLGHLVTLCLTFWGTARLFSKAATPFTIPQVVSEGSIFSTSSALLVIICLFDVAALAGMKRYEILTRISLTPDEPSFSTYRSFFYLLWRNVYADPSLILKFNYLSFYYWVVSVHYTFSVQFLIKCMIGNHFSYSVGCLFKYLMILCVAQKFFNFDEVWFFLLLLVQKN